MAISHVGSATAYPAGFVGSQACNIPAGTQDGDLMLASVAVPGNRAIATPAGWTLLKSVNGTSSGNLSVYVFSKIAASEGASQTFTITASQTAARFPISIESYRGASGVADSAISGTSFSATITCPALATAPAGRVVRHVFAGSNSGTSKTFTTPAGHTARAAVLQILGLAVFDAAHAGGAVATAASTQNTTETSIGVTVALDEEESETNLVVQDATHAHTVDSPTLTQAHTLAVQDATHAHTADNVVLSVVTSLVVDDALHAHTADNVTLTQQHTLAGVADGTLAHTADTVTITFLFRPTRVSGWRMRNSHNAFTMTERMRRKYHTVPVERGINIYILDGVAYEATGVIPANADRVFLGGHVHDVTDEERVILLAAGYSFTN